MRKNHKKALSLLLALVLCLGLVPTSVIAAEPTSGTCGDNLTWSLANGTLTISGNGIMMDYSPNLVTTAAPWFSQLDQIKSVVIKDGVTSIGWSSFAYCSSLDTVIIPDSITTIEGGAFAWCDNLTTIVIPNSVTSIGNGAFIGCTRLTNIIIPNSVINIGDNAFDGCVRLFDVTISDNITRIGSAVFQGCTSLNSVVIPDGVTSIGGWIFYDCTGLTRVTIPNSVTSIGQNAFDYCTSLTDVYYAGTEKQWQSIEIGNDNDFLTSATIHYNTEAFAIQGKTIAELVELINDYLGNYCWENDDIISAYVFENEGRFINAAEVQFDLRAATKSAEWTHQANVLIGTVVIDSNTLTGYVDWGNEKEYIDFKKGPDNTENPNDLKDGIVVFSTEKSLTVQTGKSMKLGFGLIANNEFPDEWKKMALVVSDPSVISISEYEKTEYGYSIQVTGKKQGVTNVTISDSESGQSTVVAITVRDAYSGTYSYDIENMETFYPQNDREKGIETNIYDLNGLYVNNYICHKDGDHYNVTFDVYNSKYHAGAVDIYDANGNWIDCEKISKKQIISSLWDTGEQAYYLISDAVTGKMLTYEQASFSEQSSLSFEVPVGGYFTISNNFAESPGTFLYNTSDIVFSASKTLIGAASDVKEDKVQLSAFSDLIKEQITENKTVREEFMQIFKDTAKGELRAFAKSLIMNQKEEAYAGIAGLYENIIASLNLNWKHLFQTATGVGESAFKKFAGPAGTALKGCFAFTSKGSQFTQAINLAQSVDAPYATVYSSIDEGFINPHGIVVNTNGNVDADTEFHAFRVSNDDTIEAILDGSGNPAEKYELYNICFVKNDQLVQLNGKVTVRIPIPDGMSGNTCTVYRQENNGKWTIINAHVEDNYLVFETDHFSLYAVVGNSAELKITSLPNKMIYTVDETLKTDGMTLNLGGVTISNGFICDPVVFSDLGTQKITVRYGLSSTEFNVTVIGGKNTSVFTDVPSNAWYCGAVYWAVEQGITAGTGTNPPTFSPERTCTETEILTFLWRANGEPVSTAQLPFTPKNSWAEDALRWAFEKGMVSATFNESTPCTRASTAKFIWQAAGAPSASGSTFTDVPASADYAQAVAWAVAQGITQGTGNGAFSPNKTCTRAEIVTFLYRDWVAKS